MAIVRQQRQARLQRIGVINVDTGESEVYKSIARAGQSLVQSALPELQQQAQERGVNAAKEVNRQNLIEFDEEGNPKALTVPQDFGTIAARAYQTVIERRFNESMTEEIQNKSIQLAKKYPNPATYGEQMANYLAAMDKAAGGRFAEYISNTGRPILTETQAKLEISAAKARLKQAKVSAGINLFKATEKYNASVALAVTPESIAELEQLEQAVVSAAEEKFGLDQDFVAYSKALKNINFGRAAANVNLLVNSSKNLAKSDREILEAAISNRLFLPQIKDVSLRNTVAQIHKLAPEKMNELSTSFSSGVNALENIQSAFENEWMSNNDSRFDNLESTSFMSVEAAINAGENIVSDAPDVAREDASSRALNVVSKTFRNVLSDVVSNVPLDNKVLINNLEAALTQEDINDVSVKSLPSSIRNDVKSLIENLSYTDRQAILKEAKANLNADAAVVELEFNAAIEEFNKNKLALSQKADLEFANVNARIQSALDLGATERAEDMYYEFLNSDFVGNLSFSAQKEFQKLKGSFRSKISTTKANISRKSDAQKFVSLIDQLRNAKDLGRATVIRDQIKNAANLNAHNHSSDKINSWLSQADSLHSKFVGEDQANKKLVNENEARLIAEQLEDLADNGEAINISQLNNAKAKAKKLFGSNLNGYLDVESSLETSYARSVVTSVHQNLIDRTNGKGISPDRFTVLMSMSEEDISKLDKTSAEYTVAKLLSKAKKPFAAKSEVRTQINQIEELNRKLHDAFMEEFNLASSVDRVVLQGNQSPLTDLKAYENEKYTKIAGVESGQPINFDNPELLYKDGQQTLFAQQLIDDLSRGIIIPQLATYLNRVGTVGAVNTGNAFAIFRMGSGTARYGDKLNVWNMDGTVTLDAKPLARLGAAILMYEAGRAPSPEEALPMIVSNAQEVGGDIRKGIEAAIDKKLDVWINDTYSGADLATRTRLMEAALSFGYDVTSPTDLKNALDAWVDVTFGTDDMVIGNRISEDKVVGARTKYLNADEMTAMDNAAYQLVYDAIPEAQIPVLFKEMTTAGKISQVGKFLVRSKISPSWALSGVPNSAEVETKTMIPSFELRLKESPAAKGIYYVYAKTDMGLQQQYGADGVPLTLDAFDFKTKEDAHTFTEVYQSFYRSALQNDPNGAKYGNTSYMEAFGEMLGLIEPEITYGPSQATIDAERALVFSRFPERINENRAEFDRLVEIGAILPEHVDEFLEYVND
jgi:hypothetical protein